MDKNVILDLIYPKRCPLCREIRPYGEGSVCRTCFKKLKKVEPPYCMKCGKTLEDTEKEYCEDCQNIKKSFRRGFPVFFYEGAIKTALYDFKYNNQRAYADFFAECIYGHYGRELKRLGFDGIVPVPVHPHKKRKRGFNQAELIAKALGKRIGVQTYPNYLERMEDTNPQKELSDKARMKNLKNAFKIGQNTIKLKKILLVDDIYTSGATVEACTKVLLTEKVNEVYYTSVAIGKGYSG